MRRVFRVLFWFLILIVLLLVGLRGLAALRETDSVDEGKPPDGRLIDTAMGQVHVLETGPETGIPLLLIHGSVGWSAFWSETLNALGDAGYRATAIDFSPMGYSERDPSGDYGRVRQAERLIALIDAMETRPILIAHSFGAGPGMEALFRSADRFQGAVIVAGAIGVGSDQNPKTLPVVLKPKIMRELAVSATITNPYVLKPMLQLFLAKKDRALPEYLDILRRPNTRAGTTSAIADWLPTLLETPKGAISISRTDYPNLDLPVAYIWGELDTATPLPQGEELHGITKNSTLTVLPGLGHIPHIEDPDAFNAALLSALSGVVERSGSN